MSATNTAAIAAAAATIATVAVESSFIARIGWASVEANGRKISIFVVEMKSGKRYAYPNIPRSVYRLVKAAGSVGSDFNRRIRGQVEAIVLV